MALIQNAFDECEKASELPKEGASSTSSPVNIEVTHSSINSLGKLIHGELQRYRAIVHIDNLREQEKENAGAVKIPLADRLETYPIGGADLDNIVEFPPKAGLIPMKPIFLDIAWNFIGYPGQSSTRPTAPAETEAATSGEAQEQPKRGWFGFGR